MRGNEYGGLQAMQGIQEMPGMRRNREDARRQVPVLQWLQEVPFMLWRRQRMTGQPEGTHAQLH